MKKFLLAIICTVLFTSNADAQYYGLNPADWKIYTKEKGEVTKYKGRFYKGVVFSGKGMKTGYRLNLLSKVDKDKTSISWNMMFKEFYAIYIEVYTTKGKRVLRYTSLDEDIGKKNGYINFGLYSSSRNSADYPVTIYRNLQEDLDKFEKGNKIISLTAFMVKGSGGIGDIIISYPPHYADNLIERDTETIIEDGRWYSKPKHWSIFTKDKGTIEHSYYKYDQDGIKLLGKGMKTGYALSFPTLKDGYNTVQWDMKYSENYAIYFLVKTNNGVKYLRYSSLDYDKGIHDRYISFGLGAISKDGKWHTFRRNLQKDLNKFETNSKILSIQSFMIRGSGWVSNIKAIKDSSLIPIKNFDSQKFNKLLKIISLNTAEIKDTGDEHIKYVYHSDQIFFNTDDDGNDVFVPYYWVVFYTLSSDQTKLKPLIRIETKHDKLNINNIKFNSNHTRMSLDANHYNKIYQYEVLLP